MKLLTGILAAVFSASARLAPRWAMTCVDSELVCWSTIVGTLRNPTVVGGRDATASDHAGLSVFQILHITTNHVSDRSSPLRYTDLLPTFQPHVKLRTSIRLVHWSDDK